MESTAIGTSKPNSHKQRKYTHQKGIIIHHEMLF